jgi:type 1 glutamine amidotransferase
MIGTSRRARASSRLAPGAAAAFALAALPASPAFAARALRPDCPLATAPYSVDTPIADLMLSPGARDLLRARGLLDRIPPFLAGTNMPSFGTILSLRLAGGMVGLAESDMGKLDGELRRIAVTPADSVARCARYDDGRPSLSLPRRHPAILVFSRVLGFEHKEALAAAPKALSAMAERRGWSLVFTDRPGAFAPDILRHFDAVVWNNVSGDVLTVPQRAALRAYVEGGGGFAAFHGSSGDPLTLWDWYRDRLIGAQFIGHPNDPQFQAGRLVVEDKASPITRGLGDGFSLTEEWYSFARSPRLEGAHVLLTLDESSYSPRSSFGPRLAMGDHPIAWTRCVGKGRSFYSAIGHRAENYTDEKAARLLEQGIAWAAGLDGKACR